MICSPEKAVCVHLAIMWITDHSMTENKFSLTLHKYVHFQIKIDLNKLKVWVNVIFLVFVYQLYITCFLPYKELNSVLI